MLLRSGVPFHYVTSHLDDAGGLEGLADLFAAAAAVARLRRARLGLLGYPFPGMGDFAVDTTHLAATLGCTWQSLSVEDYNRRAAEAPLARRERDSPASTAASYALADDLTDADLEATARAEFALRSIVADSGWTP